MTDFSAINGCTFDIPIIGILAADVNYPSTRHLATTTRRRIFNTEVSPPFFLATGRAGFKFVTAKILCMAYSTADKTEFA